VLIPERHVSRWPFVVSVVFHLSMATALTHFVRLAHVPSMPAMELGTPTSSEDWITHLVFVPTITSAGGGGGGGNQQGPIRKAEGRGADVMTLRIAKPIVPTAEPVNAEPELPGVLLDARPLASGDSDQLGLPMGGVPYGTSLGPGSGGGVGTGRGTGIGSGVGPGVGPGSGGGMGGGVYRAGSVGVSAPTILREVRPTYPPEALRARTQGSVVLSLVVTADGLPADIRVIRSLSADLDQAAIEAVREWRFRPGRRGDTAVNVLVTIVLDFSIR
jgi:protein TonB